jgi:hypothetical protein
MLLQTHWFCGSASRRTWQKTSCIKHARLVLSSTRVWLYMSACLVALHGHGLHVVWRSMLTMSHPYFGQVWGWSPTLGKVRDLESSGTPEGLELDSKGQNTSHWGVLGVIGKVLKRRYRKCPRIGNSDICSPSYGQKKGRESNWQFDSRPLKVEDRPLPDVRFEYATWRWKDLDEGYNFGLDLVAIKLCSRELWRFKVPRVPPGQFRDSISGVLGICAIRM